MKKENALLSSISILIGAVIAILALVRGKWQTGLLVTVFAVWGLWAALTLFLPRIRNKVHAGKRRKQRQHLLQNGTGRPVTFEIPPRGTPSTEQLLLLHVNHRISMYLCSIYGNITWEWCEEHPLKLITHGGTGRIKIYGVPDYNHADVRINTRGELGFDMMKVVPMADTPKDGPAGNIPLDRQPVDPQIWFEVQGRSLLETLIADLSSRGHSQLTLNENGDISIGQDQQKVVSDHLCSFPAISHWPRLVQVLESEGLAAKIADRTIVVTW